MQNMFEDKHVNDLMRLDIEECKQSNVMVSGTNSQDKSRCAIAMSDRLMCKLVETYALYREICCFCVVKGNRNGS